MISILLDRNNFIKNLLTAKSNDFKSLFVSAKHSRPYISIGLGIHFDLSPFLFAIYVDDLIVKLRQFGFGLYVGSLFIGCILYADNLTLLSCSCYGLQKLIVGWKPILYWLFLDFFRNKSSKPQPIRTKVGTHAQVKGRQRSRNIRRDRLSGGEMED